MDEERPAPGRFMCPVASVIGTSGYLDAEGPGLTKGFWNIAVDNPAARAAARVGHLTTAKAVP